MSASGITRRELVRRGGLLSLAAGVSPGGAVSAEPAAAPAAAGPGLRLGPEIYQSIGVRPFVNARGTYTILTGSTLLPEVRAAMGDASRHYVQLDELAEAVGKRLAELTQAEWGMVTSGCSAALTHATAACVTGGNPDLHVRLPDLRGFAKDECIIPKHSRNVYDAAVRAVGRARRRGGDRRRARGGVRPAHRARLHPGRTEGRRGSAQHARRSARRRRSAACRCWWTRRPRS